MKRRMLALALNAALISVPAMMAQSGPTEETLKTTHQTLVAAFKSGNPTMAEPLLHPNALGFFRDSQVVAQLGREYGAKDAVPAVLADLARFEMVPYDAVYRVVGNTGVVCLANNFQAKKGEKAQDRYIRNTMVYAFVGGNWRLLSWHSSDTPLKK
jgi:hypothetical protein